MTTDTPKSEERRRAATEQAGAWLVEMRSGRLSAGERGEFVDWLRESPVHIMEMLRVSQVDHALETFTGWSETNSVMRTADNIVRPNGEWPRVQRQRARFKAASQAIAAGLAVVAVATGIWFAMRETGAIVRTELAERREVTLADGSVVSVAPLSELRIRFTADRRSIGLRRGHVLFDVSPDQRRPFVVDAGNTIVRAVGTSFDVDMGEGTVRVTVIKGRVLVEREGDSSGKGFLRDSAAPDRVQLAANEEVVVPVEAPMDSVRTVNGAAQAAWATGTLVFEDETVAEVVRRFNLHNIRQIQILDPQIARRRISGTFKASDPESFVAFIRTTRASSARDRPPILLELGSQ